MINTIFISYSRKNRREVATLVRDLETVGYEVWFDQNLTGGHEWWATILEKIRECDLFICALTQATLDSAACEKEWVYAHQLNKRILPIILGEITVRLLPTELQRIQFVDYRDRNADTVLSLINALRKLPNPNKPPISLPPEPEIPLSPLVSLEKDIRNLSTNSDEQRLLVSKLSDFLNNEEFDFDARVLLERLASHENLLRRFGDEIANLLKLPIFTGHTDTVRSIAFSPDGHHLLTGSYDKTARLWDVKTGHLIRQFVGHKDRVRATFSPDGLYIFTGSSDTTAALWETETGTKIREFVGHTEPINCVAFSPDGKATATGSDDCTIRVWSPITGSEIRLFSGHDDEVWFVAFSSEGKKILSGSKDRSVRLWDVQGGEEERRFIGHRDGVTTVAFSPDNKTILTASWDKTARIWDIESGKELQRFKEHNAGVRATFSPDGRYVLTGSSDRRVYLWEVKTGKKLREFNGSTDKVYCVAFSPDSRYIAIGSVDKSARIWVSGLNQ